RGHGLHGQRRRTSQRQCRPRKVAPLHDERCEIAQVGETEIETSSDPLNARATARRTEPPPARLCWGYSEVGSVPRAQCPQERPVGARRPWQSQTRLAKFPLSK